MVNDPMKRDVPSRSVPVPCVGDSRGDQCEEEEGSTLVMISTTTSAQCVMSDGIVDMRVQDK